mmetsp:Transcript_45501/g.138323  ORF Transcript_45501/g.138323 Transcript_45501/m.138323 type:complete len:639 (-) Transcript_45501:167-2083(-)
MILRNPNFRLRRGSSLAMKRLLVIDFLLCVLMPVSNSVAAIEPQFRYLKESGAEEYHGAAIWSYGTDTSAPDDRALETGKGTSKGGKGKYHASKKSRSSKSKGKGKGMSHKHGKKEKTRIKVKGDVDIRLEARPLENPPGAFQVEIEDTGTLIVSSGAATLTFNTISEGETVPPKVEVQFPIDMIVSSGTALMIAKFMIYQLSTIPTTVDSTSNSGSAGRRLDSPGCDLFPDAPCNLGCCAVHDRCYDENDCSAWSWVRTACEAAVRKANSANIFAWAVDKLLDLANLPTFDLGGKIGKVACSAVLSPVGLSHECSKCNDAAVTCIAKGCTPIVHGFFPAKSEKCYDNKCDEFFECEGKCDFFDLSDEKCCGCQTPGDSCSSPATCGNGICESGEDKDNCEVDCSYTCTGTESAFCWSIPELIQLNPAFDNYRECIAINSDVNNCGSCGSRCNFECQSGECLDPVGNSIGGWQESGPPSAYAWQVYDDERTIFFRFQDSTSCNSIDGADDPQEGGLSTSFTTITEVNLKFIISGQVESQIGNQDQLEIQVDGTPVVLAKSSFHWAWNLFPSRIPFATPSFGRCQMSPPIVSPSHPSYDGSSGIRLAPGAHTIEMSVQSGGNVPHKDAIYEIVVMFFKA